MRWRQASGAGLLLGIVLAAVGAVDAQELRLADGRAAVAAGIVLVGPEHSAEGLALADPVVATLDRHGRVRAQLRAADGGWLQAALVARGEAVVAPADDVPAAALTELLGLERAARA